MTANQMIDLMNRSPFQPLEIQLSDGAAIYVEEPFQISMAQNSSTCTIYEGEKMRIVAFRNITEVVSSVNGK